MLPSKVFFATLLHLLITITTITGTLYESDFDLSNLDISNHKFFKNFPDLSKHPKANAWDHIDQHFQKKFAVAKYFGRLVFGTPEDNEVVKIEFDPNFGHAWRPYYQRRYGYRGERLIENIGKGYSPNIERKMILDKRQRQAKFKKPYSNSKFRIFYL